MIDCSSPASPFRVSVVIPCYNRADLVGEAIESVVSQGDEFEVVVVDDGSTDNSWAVIQEFGDRIRGIQIANSGLSEARNVGYRNATARFVRFLDSDDRIPAGGLSGLLEAAEKLPPKHIAVGDAASIDAAGNRIDPFGYGYSDAAAPGVIPRDILIRRIMNAWLPLFPIDALREVGGFDKNVILVEDHDIAMRLVQAGYQFVRVPIEVCEVREHGGERLSRDFGAVGYQHLTEAFGHIWSGLRTASDLLLTSADRAALGKLVWATARHAGQRGFAREAANLFALATGIAGSDAREGRLPIRLLYRVLPPLTAEKVLMLVKSKLRRSM